MGSICLSRSQTVRTPTHACDVNVSRLFRSHARIGSDNVRELIMELYLFIRTNATCPSKRMLPKKK
jgi:hypothetical protein